MISFCFILLLLFSFYRNFLTLCAGKKFSMVGTVWVGAQPSMSIKYQYKSLCGKAQFDCAVRGAEKTSAAAEQVPPPDTEFVLRPRNCQVIHKRVVITVGGGVGASWRPSLNHTHTHTPAFAYLPNQYFRWR